MRLSQFNKTAHNESSLLKWRQPMGYLRESRGVFFLYTRPIFLALVGSGIYLCISGNIYSPTIRDLFFSTVTALIVGVVFFLLELFALSDGSLVTLSEQSIRYRTGFGKNTIFCVSTYKDVRFCNYTRKSSKSVNFYVLNFTVNDEVSLTDRIFRSSPIKQFAVPENIIEPVLKILQDKGVSVEEQTNLA